MFLGKSVNKLFVLNSSREVKFQNCHLLESDIDVLHVCVCVCVGVLAHVFVLRRKIK